VKREEQDKNFHLLANLKPEFEEVRRDILMRVDLPSLDTVCSIIQTKETQRRMMIPEAKVINSSPPENYAHRSKLKDAGKGKKISRFHCDHCNKGGHTKDRCWILYPHLKVTKNRTSEANMCAQSEVTTVQHQLEQLNKQMELLMKNYSSNFQSANSNSGKETTNMVKLTGKHVALSALSHPHIVVDSGATDTMFNSKYLLTNFKHTNNYPHITVARSSIPTSGSSMARIFSKDIEAVLFLILKLIYYLLVNVLMSGTVMLLLLRRK
jgi:hypothetical protein